VADFESADIHYITFLAFDQSFQQMSVAAWAAQGGARSRQVDAERKVRSFMVAGVVGRQVGPDKMIT